MQAALTIAESKKKRKRNERKWKNLVRQLVVKEVFETDKDENLVHLP